MKGRCKHFRDNLLRLDVISNIALSTKGEPLLSCQIDELYQVIRTTFKEPCTCEVTRATCDDCDVDSTTID